MSVTITQVKANREFFTKNPTSSYTSTTEIIPLVKETKQNVGHLIYKHIKLSGDYYIWASTKTSLLYPHIGTRKTNRSYKYINHLANDISIFSGRNIDVYCTLCKHQLFTCSKHNTFKCKVSTCTHERITKNKLCKDDNHYCYLIECDTSWFYHHNPIHDTPFVDIIYSLLMKPIIRENEPFNAICTEGYGSMQIKFDNNIKIQFTVPTHMSISIKNGWDIFIQTLENNPVTRHVVDKLLSYKHNKIIEEFRADVFNLDYKQTIFTDQFTKICKCTNCCDSEVRLSAQFAELYKHKPEFATLYELYKYCRVGRYIIPYPNQSPSDLQKYIHKENGNYIERYDPF
jgi:hypothetical protein